MKSKFTTNAQDAFHLYHCTHEHLWSRTVAPFRRSSGGCEWFDIYEKCMREVSVSSFSIAAEYIAPFICLET